LANVITHREFKLLLKAEYFPTRRSMVAFNDLLSQIANDLHVRYDEFDSIDSQIRQVRFFDYQKAADFDVSHTDER
jgi:hypothetical protein